MSPAAAPTPTRTLHKGISVFKDRSQAMGTGPACFVSVADRNARARPRPMAPGSPPSRVSSTRDGGFRSSASFGRVSSTRREAADFHPVGVSAPIGTRLNEAPKTKRAGRRFAFSDSSNYIIAHFWGFASPAYTASIANYFICLGCHNHVCGA